MTKFEFYFIDDFDCNQVDQFKIIFDALIRSGGLSGVKSGKTILHFDKDGIFQGIELDYWPWRRRTLDK